MSGHLALNQGPKRALPGMQQLELLKMAYVLFFVSVPKKKLYGKPKAAGQFLEFHTRNYSTPGFYGLICLQLSHPTVFLRATSVIGMGLFVCARQNRHFVSYPKPTC